MTTFTTFKTFQDKETAEDFSDVLKEKGIEFYIEEDEPGFDPSYANNPMDTDYHIMIPESDFEKANQAYEDYFEKQLDHIPSDYYLYSFTDKELKEIVAKPDVWGSLDYLLAQKILAQRGLPVSEEEKQTLRTERSKALQQPEKEKDLSIILYYIISLFFPVGIVIGWVWTNSKKTLPDGTKVHRYDANLQRHGRIIFIFSLLLLVLAVLFSLARRQ
jgi:hypothetical protein